MVATKAGSERVQAARKKAKKTKKKYRKWLPEGLRGRLPKEQFYQCWTLFFTFWRAENRLLKGIAKDVQITYLRVRKKNWIPMGSIEQIAENEKSKCAAE